MFSADVNGTTARHPAPYHQSHPPRPSQRVTDLPFTSPEKDSTLLQCRTEIVSLGRVLGGCNLFFKFEVFLCHCPDLHLSSSHTQRNEVTRVECGPTLAEELRQAPGDATPSTVPKRGFDFLDRWAESVAD